MVLVERNLAAGLAVGEVDEFVELAILLLAVPFLWDLLAGADVCPQVALINVVAEEGVLISFVVLGAHYVDYLEPANRVTMVIHRNADHVAHVRLDELQVFGNLVQVVEDDCTLEVADNLEALRPWKYDGVEVQLDVWVEGVVDEVLVLHSLPEIWDDVRGGEVGIVYLLDPAGDGAPDFLLMTSAAARRIPAG